MIPKDLQISAERFAADELGFKNILDAKVKSPRLFAKIVAERISHLYTKFGINVIEHYTQQPLF